MCVRARLGNKVLVMLVVIITVFLGFSRGFLRVFSGASWGFLRACTVILVKSQKSCPEIGSVSNPHFEP